MILDTRAGTFVELGAPRASGDDPMECYVSGTNESCSPRERG